MWVYGLVMTLNHLITLCILCAICICIYIYIYIYIYTLIIFNILTLMGQGKSQVVPAMISLDIVTIGERKLPLYSTVAMATVSIIFLTLI